MKKHVVAWLLISLSFSMSTPAIAQNSAAERLKKSAIEQLEKIKSRFELEVDELKKCIKKDQNCDPMRKKIYISMVAIGVLTIAIGTGTGIGYLIKKNQLWVNYIMQAK